jgi:hypothetical protein
MAEFRPVLIQLMWNIPWNRKWTAFCGCHSRYPTPVFGPLTSEAPMANADMSLVVLESTTLLHIPAGTIFQLHCAPLHFCRRVSAFRDRELTDRWIGKGEPIPWPPRSPNLILLDIFSRVCKIHRLSWKTAKDERVSWQNRQSCRVRYQCNACQYLARNWISSWYVSCH